MVYGLPDCSVFDVVEVILVRDFEFCGFNFFLLRFLGGRFRLWD